MKIKRLRNNEGFRIPSNKYLLATIAFISWILFLDNNSWFNTQGTGNGD